MSRIDPLQLARELVAALEARSGHTFDAIDTLTGRNDEGDLVKITHEAIVGMVQHLGEETVYDMLVAPTPRFRFSMSLPEGLAT